MHVNFCLDGVLTTQENLNLILLGKSGQEKKEYLANMNISCGFIEQCKAILKPALIKKTDVVYLRSISLADHNNSCLFNELKIFERKILEMGKLDFLLNNFKDYKKTLILNKKSQLISGVYKNKKAKLSDYFKYLKESSELEKIKQDCLIDKNNYSEWFDKNYSIKNKVVLICGKLESKFTSCNDTQCKDSYRCPSNHKIKDFKLEIKIGDITFHISVSKEIYEKIIWDKIDLLRDSLGEINFKNFYILAKINRMKQTSKKSFYTVWQHENNSIIKNKKHIEEIS